MIKFLNEISKRPLNELSFFRRKIIVTFLGGLKLSYDSLGGLKDVKTVLLGSYPQQAKESGTM